MKISTATLSLVLASTSSMGSTFTASPPLAFAASTSKSTGVQQPRFQLFAQNKWGKDAENAVDDFEETVEKRSNQWQKNVEKARDKFGNRADDIQDGIEDSANTLQAKAEEFKNQFLIVDIEGARQQLADNWGWITASGALTIVLGALAFYLPTFATGVAYDGTVLTLGATGIIGLFGAFVRENGHKFKSFFSGLAYIATAFLMSAYPGQGLQIITLGMATAILAEGLFETTLAIRNKNLQGRGWHFVSGIGSAAAALGLTAAMPVSSLIVPGVALGARLTTTGATKVAVGLEGKKIADKR